MSCAAKERMNRPERKAKELAKWTQERRAKQAEKMREQATTSGKFRDAVRERMKNSNPMTNLETREKMRRKLIGRTFLARGGNGQLTRQQIAVAALFPQAVTEYPIAIPADLRGQIKSPPKCYHVDIGFADKRIAVEIDGKTHLTPKWRFLDKRKEEILALLGWQVIRFTNQDCDERIGWVKEEIEKELTREQSCA